MGESTFTEPLPPRPPNFDPLRFAQPVIVASESERRKMIADAAYFRAQSRDFESGHEVEDWLEAEAEVDRKLAAGRMTPGDRGG
jgi:hypothetical protein